MGTNDFTHYMWLDLETAGTDEYVHPILEIGCVLTTRDLVTVEAFQSVVHPCTDDWAQHMDPYVLKMHIENGLLRELQNVELSGVARDFDTLAVEDRIVQILGRNGIERHMVMLAGSGVSHFDRRFLKEQMPKLERCFVYPAMDIGVVRRFLEKLCGWTLPDPASNQDAKTHRALDDAYQHLQEARSYVEIMRSLTLDSRIVHHE